MLTDRTNSIEARRFAVLASVAIAACTSLLLMPAAAVAQGFIEMRGGSERSSDRGNDDRDRDRKDRDRKDSDRSDRGDRGSSFSSNSSQIHSSATSSNAGGMQKSTQPRQTMELQSSYTEVDSDRDGQLGLYEWKKSKRPLAQFNQMDVNHDGFLTPAELKRAEAMGTMMAAVPGSIPTGTSPQVVASPTVSAPTPLAPLSNSIVATMSPEERAKVDAEQAKNFFGMLDKDRDGKLSAPEMANSKTIRPLFESAGLNFNEPMSTDQFVTNYVAIQKGKRT